RRFARSRGADEADRLALADLQTYILEDVNAGRAAAQGEIDPCQGNSRSRGLRSRDIVHEPVPCAPRQEKPFWLIWEGCRRRPGIHWPSCPCRRLDDGRPRY